jgi:class 3 adenylate cyclase
MRTFLTVFFGGVLGILLMLILRAFAFGPEFDALIMQGLGRNPLSTIVSADGSFLLGIGLAFAMAWVAVDVPRGSQRWLLGLFTMLLLVTGALVLALYNVMFSPVAPLVGALGGLAATTGLTRIGPGAYRRRVDEVFGASLSRKSLRKLYDGSATVLQPSQKSAVSVVVLELSNHGPLMELMEPADFAEMSRRYLSLAGDFFCESGAFLESCSGHQVRAVFGVPNECEEPGELACRIALELNTRLERLNLESDSRWHHILEFHIGVASGEAIGGVFGSPRALPYAVVGPPVDQAARLTNAAEQYGCRIIVCPQTYRQAAEAIEVRPMDLVHDRGGEELEIYELLGLKGALSPERKRSREHFWTGVNLVRSRRWDDAVEEFSKARIKGIPDAPLDFYLQRIERERKSGGATHTPDLRHAGQI